MLRSCSKTVYCIFDRKFAEVFVARIEETQTGLRMIVMVTPLSAVAAIVLQEIDSLVALLF